MPIFKSGDKKLATNYRPISLISNIAKLFEKLIHHRIYKFLDKHKIFSDKQFGFRKNIGTKDALSYVTNHIINSMNSNKKTVGTFIDLAKAFDTVNHEILLQKLERYGVRGSPKDLLKSYLSNRYQKVRINGTYSNLLKVNTGVPQGTILGPLLFVVYIDDLLETLQDCFISSYADDMVIICVSESWKETEDKMNHYLEIVYKWLSLNDLSLNIEKTVFIIFGSNADSEQTQLNIKIDSQEILKVEHCKYLGLTIDSRLKWNEHTAKIISISKYIIYIMYKMSIYMNAFSLMALYYAFFHSIATYGIIAWGGAYDNALSGTQRIQNRLIKTICKKDSKIKLPLSIKECFLLETTLHDYAHLSLTYKQSKNSTRNKIILPKINKTLQCSRL